MKAFIHSAANISPQQTWDAEALTNVALPDGDRLRCIEPDYNQWIDIKQQRRMSRIMKMGAAAALLALKKANVSSPDAVIAATGFGCVEDTGLFLQRMFALKEVALNPTPFIQSTHNTIGSNLALMIRCERYNQTYSHGAHSFETALIDAMLHVSESPEKKILVGATDEITDVSHAIQRRFGIFKDTVASSKTKGTYDGEGAAWFVVSGQREGSNVTIEGVETFYKPKAMMSELVEKFLQRVGVAANEVDLLLLGKSGDAKLDGTIDKELKGKFDLSSTATFKHLCGEYPVASSFALWMANSILKTGLVPRGILQRDSERSVKSILIYNVYFRDHHSLVLLKRNE